MIKMPFPQMALNSRDVPGWDYQMYDTWSKIEKTITALQIAARIFAGAVTAPEKKFNSVVLNAHGKPGKIKIGEGITQKNLNHFRILKGVVSEIWIIACNVAATKESGTITDGQIFCSQFAKTIRAYIFAGVCEQTSYPILPYVHIDDMEGLVYCCDPDGKRISQKDFGSASIISLTDFLKKRNIFYSF